MKRGGPFESDVTCVNLHAIGEAYGCLPSDLLRLGLADLMICAEVLGRAQKHMKESDGTAGREGFDPKSFGDRVRAMMEAKEARG